MMVQPSRTLIEQFSRSGGGGAAVRVERDRFVAEQQRSASGKTYWLVMFPDGTVREFADDKSGTVVRRGVTKWLSQAGRIPVLDGAHVAEIEFRFI